MDPLEGKGAPNDCNCDHQDDEAKNGSPPLTPSTVCSLEPAAAANSKQIETPSSSSDGVHQKGLPQLLDEQESSAPAASTASPSSVFSSGNDDAPPVTSPSSADSKDDDDIVQITLDSFSLRQWPSVDSCHSFARQEVRVRHLFAADAPCSEDKVIDSSRCFVCPHEADTGKCAYGYICPNAYRCPHDDGYTPLEDCCTCQEQYVCPHEPHCPYRQYGQCPYRFNGPADKAFSARRRAPLFTRKNTLQVQKEQFETFAERTVWNIIKHILLLGPPAYAKDDPRRQRKLTYLAEMRYPPSRGRARQPAESTRDVSSSVSVAAQ